MNNNIVMINRSKLQPHPDNPRKDLGDLTELANSIAEHGIMQNLTVVPFGDCYRVLIGHRRLEASKGIIDELPCVIADNLTDREQVGIMLVENMQRSDLTYMEQAHGFQMMLDLGDTVETIAEKTGFSKATVKHRLAINEIDQDALAEASKYFQPTIADFIELEKVKDLEKRNEILENAMCSKDITNEVDEYLEEQTLETNFKKYKEVLDEVGWKDIGKGWISGPGFERLPEFGYGDIRLDKFEIDNVHRIRDAAEEHKNDDVYYSRSYRGITFAIKPTKEQKKDKKKTKEELREEAIKKKTNELEHARAQICDEYLRYVIDLPEKDINELAPASYKNKVGNCLKILEKNSGCVQNFSNFYGGNIRTLIHEKIDINEIYKKSEPLKKLMILVWYELALSYRNKFVSYGFEKSKPTLDSHASFYSVLFSFGFRLPKDLLEYIEGTAESYQLDGKKVKS